MSLLSRFIIPPWLKFAVPAVLLALLVIQTTRMHTAHVERDVARRENAQWAKTSKAQEQSIRDLFAALENGERQTAARAAEFERVREQDKRDVIAANTAAQSTQAQIEQLKRLAREGSAPCGVSDALRAALKGL